MGREGTDFWNVSRGDSYYRTFISLLLLIYPTRVSVETMHAEPTAAISGCGDDACPLDQGVARAWVPPVAKCEVVMTNDFCECIIIIFISVN